MVAHWDNIMEEKMKTAQDQQKTFVTSQLGRGSKVPVTTSWREEISNWNEAKRLVKERSATLDREETGAILVCLPRRLALFLGYFLALTFGLWFLMVVTCPRGWGLNVHSDGFLTIFAGAWNFGSAPWGWLFLFSSILETFIFVSACFVITWPEKPPPVPRADQQARTAPIASNGGNGRACLLIACHNSSIDLDAQADISRTIRAALANFPPEAIFVCDNGGGIHPSDDTEGFVQSICHEVFPGRRLNYVYIPEGNKTHSLYWTTELWIPSLHQRGVCPDFEYLVMIDDDVPLPEGFDFQENLLAQDLNTVAVAYTIQAVSAPDENGESSRNWLLSMQDVEYKVSGFFKLFQSHFGSAFYAHGAVSLWRRKVLGTEILYRHDTAFHGEDLYMGLLLHRESQGKKIVTSGAHAVETYAPDDFLTLFRQRVKSWDLAAHRKFFSIFGFLTCFWSNQHWILKPFMFGEVVAVLQDWLRMYMVLIIIVVDPKAMLAIMSFFILLALLQLCLFNFVVMRRRPDLRFTFCTIICFPFYKMVTTLLFRQYALMENVIKYSLNRKPRTIEYRFTTQRDALSGLQDFPPTPDVQHPDWWHVWHNEESSDPESGGMRRRKTNTWEQSGALKFMPAPVYEAMEEACGVGGTIRATLPRDQLKVLHALSSFCLFSQLQKENGYVSIRPETYNEIHSRMKTCLAGMITNVKEAERLVDTYIHLWEVSTTNGTGTWLYMTSEISQKQQGWEQALAQANVAVLDAILEELIKLRSPSAQDSWTTVKNVMAKAVRHLKQGQLW